MGLFGNTIERVMGRLGFVRAKAEDVVRFDVRNGIYAINQSYYDASCYQTRANGGAFEDILKTYIGSAFCDVNRNRILPLFVPVAEIVDTYQHVLPGTWGDGIALADEVDGRPIAQAIRDPIARIWRASNLDTEKAKFIRWCANFGTVGLRIVARAGDGTRPPRVSIVADHPSRLFNFEEDGEGNVTAVCLKYVKPINRGTLDEPQWEDVEVVETITRDEYSLTYDGVEQLEDGERRNLLGFTPYVIQRHKDNGTQYGDWAYKGSEAAMHRLNWRFSRQDKSIDRHQFPKWFGAGGGDEPTTVEMGDTEMTWVNLHPDTPTPFLQAVVPQVDQAAAQAFVLMCRQQFRNKQPEIVLNDMELLSGISGEALELSLNAVKKRIADVRPGYVHSLTRALQMGISAGRAVNAWPIGGDDDFRAGRLNFGFGTMPLLPLTPTQRIQQATADTAADGARLDLAAKAKTLGLPEKEQWRKAGYTDDQIKALLKERGRQPTLETEDDVGEGEAA